MAMNRTEISTVEVDKNIVLNCRHEETVRHALVLLEGEIKRFTNEISCETSTIVEVAQEDTALESNIQNVSKSKANNVFVYHKEQCHRWPVVDDRFKAFVKLDKGVNLVKIQCQELGLAKDLRICYEKQQCQQRYIL